jgi:hypothetical protein
MENKETSQKKEAELKEEEEPPDISNHNGYAEEAEDISYEERLFTADIAPDESVKTENDSAGGWYYENRQGQKNKRKSVYLEEIYEEEMYEKEGETG